MKRKTVFSHYGIEDQVGNVMEGSGFLVQYHKLGLNRGGKVKKIVVSPTFAVLAADNHGVTDHGVVRLGCSEITFPVSMAGKKIRLHVEVLDD